MASSLKRFLNLERPRPATAGMEPSPAPSSLENGRFEALESAAPEPAPERGFADKKRFEKELGPSLELDPVSDHTRPFTRCQKCGRDHGRFERTCAGCGEALDTDEQRAFNERLWETQQAEAQRAEAENRAAAPPEVDPEELSRMRREMGVSLAQEVAKQEAARLRLSGGWGRFYQAGDPVGLTLLRLFPEKARSPLALATGLALLASLLLGMALHSPTAIVLALTAGIGLFVPGVRASGPGDLP